MFYLMDVEKLSYEDAKEEVKDRWLLINLPQKFDDELKALMPWKIGVEEPWISAKMHISDKEHIVKDVPKNKKPKEYRSEDEIEMEKLVKKLYSSCGKKAFPEVVNTIERICKNIISHPNEEKFWWLKLSNKKIKS